MWIPAEREILFEDHRNGEEASMAGAKAVMGTAIGIEPRKPIEV